jgi:hypothetical protein
MTIDPGLNPQPVTGTSLPFYIFSHAGFEVLAAVVMNSSVVWDVTPFSSLKVDLRLGGTCRLRLQGKIISQPRNQLKAGS